MVEYKGRESENGNRRITRFLGLDSGDLISTLVRFILPKPYRLMEPRFPLGEVYTSAGAAERLAEEELLQILHRHHCGDWGDLGDGDKQANEEALQTGERILSRYNLKCGSFYIITEANRSVTTVMGVEEY